MGISLDETTTRADVEALWGAFANGAALPVFDAVEAAAVEALPAALRRESAFLTHPVFHAHHSETRMLRYLRALTLRLQRQANDPQKDQQKAQSVVPLWQSFVARRDAVVASGRSTRELEDFGWLLEELRVQVFAPELKTAVAVSLPRVREVWASLAR